MTGGTRLRLGILSDEIDADFERALDVAKEWGLQFVDLRTLWGKNVVQLTDAEVARVKEALERRGLVVECVASPVFKSPLREGDARLEAGDFAAPQTDPVRQLAILGRALAIAKSLGAPTVRAFSFWRRPLRNEARDELTTHLARAARLVGAHGRVLAIENEFTCNAATGAETGALLAQVGLPSCKAIWDPANARVAGEVPFPDGYRVLRRSLAMVHVKDCVYAPPPGENWWRVAGEGEVNWRAQLAALVADGYKGPLTLEPHQIQQYTRQEGAYRCLQNLRAMLAEVV